MMSIADKQENEEFSDGNRLKLSYMLLIDPYFLEELCMGYQ